MELTTKVIKRVGFFGDADISEKDEVFKQAYETAKLLAQNGYIIVNGGGTGVMLAATLGGKAGGGQVETVVIDPKINMGPNFKEESAKNVKNTNKRYVVANYDKRLTKLVDIADAFVIFKGGTGTLAEMGLVWNKAKLESGRHEPVIFFGGFWEDIVKDMTDKLGLEKVEQEVVEVVETAEEVLDVLRRVKGEEPVRLSWWEKVVSWAR